MDTSAIERRTVKKVTRRLIPFLFLCFAISILERVNIGFAALQMNSDLGFSSAVFGFGAGIFFLGYFLLEVPGGALMTKVGARAWISRIMVSWGLVSCLTAFVTTDIQFYVVRFALGVCEASFFPCMAWYLSNWFQTKHHAKAIAGFMIAIPCASAFGSPISTYLLQVNLWGLHGWQSLFILEAIPSLILGIIVYFFLDDKIEDASWLDANEKEWLIGVVSEEQKLKASKKSMTFLAALKERDVLVLSVGYFSWMCGYYGIVMFLPTLVTEMSKSLSMTVIGWVIGVMYLFAAIIMYLNGLHSDKTNERRYHVAVCLVVSAIGMVGSLYAAQVNVVLGLLIYAVALAGAYGAYSPFWAIPPAYLSGPAAAAGIAFINSVGNLGGFMGPYVMGYISTVTGVFNAGMLFLAACMVVSAVVITVFVKQTGKALREDENGHDQDVKQAEPVLHNNEQGMSTTYH